MTQIQTVSTPSEAQGPRGIPARGLGGAYAPREQQDIIDGDSLQGPLIFLTGTTDAINPFVAGNYIIDTGQADAITLGLPRDGIDDNLSINIWSDSAFAHSVTLPSASFSNGVIAGGHTTITFAAAKGAGVTLRAMDGTWHVISQAGITFS